MNPEELQKTSELIQAGKLDDAERLCREALRTAPKQFHALYLLGFTQMRKKEFDSAEKTIREAIQLNASMPDAHYNRGCALQELGRDADALASFERALLLNPHYLHAEFNRATSLLRLRRLEEAEMAFANLIQKTPQDAEVWHNRGDALFGMSKTMDAIACFEQALMLAPKSLRTLELHATAFIRLRDFETASIDYEKIVAMGPQHEYAQGNLLYTRLNCCDWRNLEIQKKNVEAGVKAGKSIISPFVYVLVSQTPAAQRSCAEIWLKKNFSKLPEPLGGEERYGHKKIRLAYVSGDFRNHAVARLMAGIIESHDRERFEIYGIALGVDDDSAMRQRLKSAFDHFQVVNTMTDYEAAIWMREHEIDIAVDLMICTGDCRPGIFANRAAPIQVNYLGFAGTSGSYYLDYILADAVVIPEEDKPHYSEKVVYLPNTFQPNDSQRKAAEAVPTRAMEGLPETGFVFCSFNNSCKILPEIFDIWMRILRGVEGSVLWLPKRNSAEETNLRREAAARGTAPERIIFSRADSDARRILIAASSCRPLSRYASL